MKSLGIIVNPMSGRDVRRVAARASTSNHHEKRQLVTRLVLGALEMGVEKIFLADEPFKINKPAVEHLPEKDKVEILEFPLTHTSRDTETMLTMMWEAGCRTFVVLGGDGTSKIVAQKRPDSVILPISTGTNNVFPVRTEASIAGAAAGLIASGKMKFENHTRRCKQIHVMVNGVARGLALIDAVLLKNDSLGSLLPFAGDNLSHLFLTRAEPASVGLSPIGGYVMPCMEADDSGVMLACGKDQAEISVRVPISPGLYNEVGIQKFQAMDPGQAYEISDTGVFAFDGDREFEITPEDQVEVVLRRDGPWVIQPEKIMATAAEHGLLYR